MASLSFDDSSGRFRDNAGRFVSDRAVRSVVDQIADGASERMAQASARMLAGELSLAEFQAELMRTIKLSHVATATIANGGAARMDFSAYGRVGAAIKAQYQYARGFAEAVADGTQPLNGTLAARARQYGHAARVYFEDERFRSMRSRTVLCRNRINSGESCAGCRAETAKGWVRPSELVPVGSRVPCLSRCRCSVDYRTDAVEAAA
jgi:hypothetical protein